MDSRQGRELYKFDMSLMERLSSSGLGMSRIDVQRRMRPTISSLIRFVSFFWFCFLHSNRTDSNALYPGLEDHELVLKHPDVRGISKNVFFLTHQHRENDGGDDTASKYNTYEVSAHFSSCRKSLTSDQKVAMISDLVLYLLRLVISQLTLTNIFIPLL